ncbi:MAG: PilZ domain-containing protein [Deltaproteobacteria bacterium]|nr:PilZ domain-containing protein [Deltaproteobacteria bacterium]
MNQLDYLSRGKDIDLQFNIDGEKLKYAGKVCDVNNGTFSIEINDEGVGKNPIPEGTKAFLMGQHLKKKIRLPIRIENAEDLPIIRIKEDNSRSHVRADGFIRLKCEKIAEEEYVKKREQYINEINPEIDIEVNDPEFYCKLESDIDTNVNPEKFINEIHLLNKKLYFLQKLMTHSEEIDIFEQQPLKVNISGSGMKFNCSGYFQVGDLLDLKMVLPTSPFFIVKAVGLVVRVDKLPEKTLPLREASNYLAIKFIAINEDNMEAIIRCVFKLQRKNLRKQNTL